MSVMALGIGGMFIGTIKQTLIGGIQLLAMVLSSILATLVYRQLGVAIAGWAVRFTKARAILHPGAASAVRMVLAGSHVVSASLLGSALALLGADSISSALLMACAAYSLGVQNVFSGRDM